MHTLLLILSIWGIAVSANNYSSSKRGLVYVYNDDPSYNGIWTEKGSDLTWYYNYGAYPSSGLDLEFVPMLWGNASSHTTNWAANVENAISRGTKAILAFNEPDACGWGQSCMTPQAAVNAYRQYIQPFAGRVKLGGPAVTEVGTTVSNYFRLSLGT